MTWKTSAVLAWCVVVGAFLALGYESRQAAQRAVAALEVDGYSDIQLVGHSCRVARATDASGERVEAYACEWSR